MSVWHTCVMRALICAQDIEAKEDIRCSGLQRSLTLELARLGHQQAAAVFLSLPLHSKSTPCFLHRFWAARDLDCWAVSLTGCISVVLQLLQGSPKISSPRNLEQKEETCQKMVGKAAGSVKAEPVCFLWTGFKCLNLAFPEQGASFLLHFPSLSLLLHTLICGKRGCLQFYTHCLFRVTFIHVKHSYLCFKGTWYNIFEIIWIVKKPKPLIGSVNSPLGGGMTCKLNWGHLKGKAFHMRGDNQQTVNLDSFTLKKLSNKFIMCTKQIN